MATTVRNRKIGIVAFCFGEPAQANPNPKIARWAQALGAPIFTEKEISRHLESSGLDVEVLGSSPGTTLNVSQGAVQWAIKHGLEGLMVVAVEPHMSRCKRDMRRAIRDSTWSGFLLYGEVGGYIWDPRATTPHSRSPFHWWSREIILRLLPWPIYKRIAS